MFPVILSIQMVCFPVLYSYCGVLQTIDQHPYSLCPYSYYTVIVHLNENISKNHHFDTRQVILKKKKNSQNRHLSQNLNLKKVKKVSSDKVLELI